MTLAQVAAQTNISIYGQKTTVDDLRLLLIDWAADNTDHPIHSALATQTGRALDSEVTPKEVHRMVRLIKNSEKAAEAAANGAGSTKAQRGYIGALFTKTGLTKAAQRKQALEDCGVQSMGPIMTKLQADAVIKHLLTFVRL
jgi:hypothetical protein